MTKPKAKHNQTIPLPGDVYIRGFAVYRVSTYNETDDTVLFSTTNDIITLYGKTKRLQVRQNNYHPCPFQLLMPAVQVFELDEKLSDDSLKMLKAYCQAYTRTYEKLGLIDLLRDIEDAPYRVYQIPDEQGAQFPDLKGKSFNIPVPFYCLTKEVYKERYQSLNLPTKDEFFQAMRYNTWPIFYVPQRFR